MATSAAPRSTTPPRNCPQCGKPAKKRCSRCKSVFFCNLECQKKAWKTHKAECVITPLPEPPSEPVGLSDTGDANFDAVLAYVDAAADAGNKGYLQQELVMWSKLIERDDKQPVVFYNLANNYHARRDFKSGVRAMDRAAELLLDSRLVQPSDPSSVADVNTNLLSPAPADTNEFICQVVTTGADLVQEAVVGRNDLVAECALMTKLISLAERVENSLPKLHASHAYHVQGNVLRKLQMEDEAIEALRAADAAMQRQPNDGKRDLVSLNMIPEVLACQALAAGSGTDEACRLIRQAVVDARVAVEATPEEDRMYAPNHLLLAKMLYNELALTEQFKYGPDDRTDEPVDGRIGPMEYFRELIKETSATARLAQILAEGNGDARTVSGATLILENLRQQNMLYDAHHNTRSSRRSDR